MIFPILPFPFFGIGRGCGVSNCQCRCHKDKWYDKFWGIALCVTSAFVVILWFAVTMIDWLGGDGTLMHEFAAQWKFIISALHRIW